MPKKLEKTGYTNIDAISGYKTSTVYPTELNSLCGGEPLATIIFSQLLYWFRIYPDGFYKSINKQNDKDSWCSELNITYKKFVGAFDLIGIRYPTKTSHNSAEDKFSRIVKVPLYEFITRGGRKIKKKVGEKESKETTMFCCYSNKRDGNTYWEANWEFIEHRLANFNKDNTINSQIEDTKNFDLNNLVISDSEVTVNSSEETTVNSNAENTVVSKEESTVISDTETPKFPSGNFCNFSDGNYYINKDKETTKRLPETTNMFDSKNESNASDFLLCEKCLNPTLTEVESGYYCIHCKKEVKPKKCTTRGCKRVYFKTHLEDDEYIYYKCVRCNKELQKKKTDPRVIAIIENFYDGHRLKDDVEPDWGRDGRDAKELLKRSKLQNLDGDAIEYIKQRQKVYFDNDHYRAKNRWSFSYFCKNFDLFVPIDKQKNKKELF
jgi:hypothetical protein